MTNSQKITQELLSTVKSGFEKALFSNIDHLRLSIETTSSGLNSLRYDDIDSVSFEGLSKAMQNQQAVMIKWSVVSTRSHIKSRLADELNKRDALCQTIHTNRFSVNVVPILSRAKTVIEFNDQKWQFIYYVMPYYYSGSVKDYLKHNILDHQQKEALIKALALVIKDLHKADWIHGDIKPSNFLIKHSDTHLKYSVCLTDFSCAFSINANIEKVKQNNIMGTPAYLAPECWSGNQATIQSDIYAFGVMVFEIMMGKKPVSLNSELDQTENNDYREWAIAHRQQQTPLLDGEWKGFQSVLDKLLAKQTTNRFKDLSQFIESFNQYY